MIRNQLGTMSSSPHKNYEEFICGFGAAAINIAVTFPINKIIFRQVSKEFSFLHQSNACTIPPQ